MNRPPLHITIFVVAMVIATILVHKIKGQTTPTAAAKVPVGGVAAQITGRLVGSGALDGEYELIGYLTFLDGIGSALFAGEASEKSAQFTLRSDRFRFQTVPNGPLIHFGRLAVPSTQPALIRFYYMASPDRDFSKPFTFSDGELIGVVRSRGIQGALTPSLMFRAEGSATVDTASEFSFGDRKLSLRSLGDSFVITMFGVAPAADEFFGSEGISVPYSASIRAADRFQDQVVITTGSGSIGPPK
ncbi:MAG: hypothetical protein HY820_03810 [Acidobacteria bacterium]|nr:hypothetical protein [Acidobacteriota bacterium]